MDSPKRNVPCPCGSGEKYKNCCLSVKENRNDRKRRIRKIFLFVATGLIVTVMATFIVYSATRKSPYESLAKCISKKGFKMYGAWWCSKCNEQKDVLGKAFKFIDYVECSPNANREISGVCYNKAIEKFPTWIGSDGERYTGVHNPAELSELSACQMPAIDD